MIPEAVAGAPILVYDGECAFCSRAVRFILDHDRRRSVRFAPRDGVAGRAARVRHPAIAAVDSLLWLERVGSDERAYVRADAALAVAAYLGGAYSVMAAAGRLVPRALLDPAYAMIARNRHRLAAGSESCLVLSPEERARLLE